MSVFFRLLFSSSIPVIVSVIVYCLDKRTRINKLSYGTRQFIYGVLFGIVACLESDMGVDVGGALANTRDSAPFCCGLIMGGPAGIIAGVMGGCYRWLSVYWGASSYTRIACSIACTGAGIYAALLRKYMFDNKYPGFLMGFIHAFILEIFHLSLVFIFGLEEIKKAFSIVSSLTIPMCVSNASAVALSLIIVSLVDSKKINLRGRKNIHITNIIQYRIMGVIGVVLGLTIVLSWIIQESVCISERNAVMQGGIMDIHEAVSYAVDNNLLNSTKNFAAKLKNKDEITDDYLRVQAYTYDVEEINIVDENGIIVYSTDDSYIGYDMSSGEQSNEFMVLLDGTDEYVQSYQPTSNNPGVWRKYCGVAIEGLGFVQMGYDAKYYQMDINQQLKGEADYRHIGETGYFVIFDADGKIISDGRGNKGRNISEIMDVSVISLNSGMQTIRTTISNEDVFCMTDYAEGYYIMGVYPYSEAVWSRDNAVLIICYMEIIMFAIIFASVYFMIKYAVVDSVKKVNDGLGDITDGKLDTVIDVRSSEEFSSLSDDINATVDTLKRYIEEASARIDEELEFARNIQYSSLPRLTPLYEQNERFNIFAKMIAAKEVGGDFFDFYFIDDNRLVILIADVSGKGIPAAMFMMKAKAMLKSAAETGESIEKVMFRSNEWLCEGNDADMFVTVWIGVVNLETGLVEYVNAGHEMPIVRKADGTCEYMQCHTDFVLGGMDGITFKKQTLQLNPGEILYLYTDGSPEATNFDKELFGTERLLESFTKYSQKEENVHLLCRAIKRDIDNFVKDAPQFDDITMLTFKYKGKEK